MNKPQSITATTTNPTKSSDRKLWRREVVKMTIQEAINSGKPFRRKGWLPVHEWFTAKQGFCTFPVDDILATDWEIKEEPREFWLIYADTIGWFESCDPIVDKQNGKTVIKVREVVD